MSETTISQTSQQESTGGLMKAVVCERYGAPNVLEIKQVEKPVPLDDEVFVKIYAASVNPADYYSMNGMARLMGNGIRKPKNPVMGTDFAGRIEATGGKVTQFHVGEEVFGGCKTGSYTEYGCAREMRIALKPKNMSLEEAAGIPIAGLTALQALRDHGQLQPGQKVLINGASGGVGTFAVQIAKALGAEVTAVCSSGNLEMVRSLGANHVIDYTKEDFAKIDERYDLICDIAATHRVSDYKRLLNPKGIFVLVGAPKNPLRNVIYYIVAGRLRFRGDKKFKFFIAKNTTKDLEFLKELAENGKLRTVIDRRYPLDEVPDAMRYWTKKHTRGKIIINVTEASQDRHTEPVFTGVGWTVRF
jgi:NADPH:quinone reductase-like Zn-dependent oxidoreductase